MKNRREYSTSVFSQWVVKGDCSPSLKLARVATFNLEYGADSYGFKRAAGALKKLQADVILLQETHSQKTGLNIAQSLASSLKMNCITFERSQTAILSRKKSAKVAEGSHFGIARIGRMYYSVIHWSHAPYSPFEAQGIPYPPECVDDENSPCFYSKNPEALIKRSLKVRGPELREFIKAVSRLPRDAKIIAGGDFNEPSHLDWTPEAVRRGEVPLAIDFPCSRIIEELGFIDTYREMNDDLGYTWPDREIEYEYRPDRIDFIFSKNLDVISSSIIKTGLSDHAIVMTILA